MANLEDQEYETSMFNKNDIERFLHKNIIKSQLSA